MIVPAQSQVLRMLRNLGWPLVLFLVWDVTVVVTYVTFIDGRRIVDLPVLPLSLLGTAIVLLLGFRNNSAYARWWEGRILWGAMVNASRSYAREVVALIDDTAEGVPLKRQLLGRQIAYVHALRCHLRRQAACPELEPLLTEAERAEIAGFANPPNAILNGTAHALAEASRRGLLTEFRQMRIEATLVDMSNAQGGMERIKNTPMPRPFTVFPRLFVNIFCALLPLGLVEALGYYTPLASGVVGFMLLAIERSGEILQDPFENSVHDVPLTAITRTIEIDLRQTMGQSHTPPPARPVDDVLW